MKPFQKPQRLASDLDTLTPTYGHFEATPFERGFGTTLGNSLRRILLSSIEGAAITAVKIEGVLHEFSAIQGVHEDVTDILMNLKQIPIRLHVKRPKTLYLESSGVGVLKSGDIKPDPDVQILDEEIHIATVSEKKPIKIEMRVKPGRGYVPADENVDEDLGYMPIDSVHSPVSKVNYYVEATRLGQATDYDRLNLDVWTNGTLSPQDAVAQAATILRDHMDIFINFEEEPEVVETEVDEELEGLQRNLSKAVEELELSVRSYNCLKNANVQTIGQLVTKTESEMLRTKNFGKKSLHEIKEILSEMGLSFGMQFDETGRVKESVEA